MLDALGDMTKKGRRHQEAARKAARTKQEEPGAPEELADEGASGPA